MKIIISFALIVGMICNINFRVIHIILYLIVLDVCLANTDTLRILNYNIYGLNPILTKDKSPDRIKSIFLEAEKYDIIFFQENWYYQMLVTEILNNHEVIIAKKTNFIRKKNPKRSSGLNLAVLNNINIDYFEENLFSECNGFLFNYNDCLASKGFIYSLISKDNYHINLYVTHLDAGLVNGDKLARDTQLNELSNHVENLQNNFPTIICGDFNINYYKSVEIIDQFIKKNNLNILRWDNIANTDEMIDYVFYKSGENHKITILDYKINKTLYNKSDHLPVEFTIVIK